MMNIVMHENCVDSDERPDASLRFEFAEADDRGSDLFIDAGTVSYSVMKFGTAVNAEGHFIEVLNDAFAMSLRRRHYTVG